MVDSLTISQSKLVATIDARWILEGVQAAMLGMINNHAHSITIDTWILFEVKHKQIKAFLLRNISYTACWLGASSLPGGEW